MNRADNEVTGEAGLNGNGGRFRVSDFPNHNHLRILAHQGTKRDRVGEFPSMIDLCLANRGKVELNRIFYRADADGGSVSVDQMTQSGVKCLELSVMEKANMWNFQKC